ncbi:uncharacterized protein LOC120350884 isoform X2 [Nilaparvata lugens]|uniref:uncharacterized protein LOC120350884 isoform X1 n=1 Tax=Nilaparvata lugens TaxID=108931 RepID=UPI00193D3CBC|nr:uncharacterized protein LOC120350884 isoform X1 [Nilaparvata lugens]XP_039281975.1 uncharacterized protein LOC120350884 isoform X2 [Nilaparvata lugens]
MADLRQCSREFLTDFISLYESFPCIWRVKSKEYSDRDKKGEAYERLVEKFKEIDVKACRETVVKKNNSLRSVYRKELAKVNKSIRSGAGEDEIYKPSLWYFDLLHFGSMNATNYWPQQNTPHQIRMQQNLSSQVGQYYSFSQQPQPMPHNYAPEQIPHTQEYETIGKISAVS